MTKSAGTQLGQRKRLPDLRSTFLRSSRWTISVHNSYFRQALLVEAIT
jgi:hypothetical protein